MNGVQVGIAVAIAVIIGVAFMFFGPAFFQLFGRTSVETEDARVLSQNEVLGVQSGAGTTAGGSAAASPAPAPQPSMQFPLTDVPTQLALRDDVVGTGAEAVSGKNIAVHYTGYLVDGTVFDSSVTRGTPFTFTLGAGQVIQGWDQGFAGMKVGGKRTLIIPPDMAYGASGAGGVIGPNATLVFEVELLGVQ